MKKFIYLLLFIGILILSGCQTSITITFDCDGGSGIASITLEEPGKIEKPDDPVKEGCFFLGWELKGEEFDFDTVIDKSIKLKAKWQESVTLTITGAGITGYEEVVPKGVEYTLVPPTKEEFKFVKWIDQDTFEEFTGSHVFEFNTVIEAVFEKRPTANITYYYGKETLKTERVYLDEDFEQFIPELKGHTFKGWYKTADLEEEVDFDNLSRSNSAYAKFEANTYTITLVEAEKTIEVKFGAKIPELQAYYKTGCNFEGWEYKNKFILKGQTYLYDCDIECHAAFSVTTTFTVDKAKNRVTYNLGDSKPFAEVIKEGFIFAGWYADKEFTGEPFYTITDTTYANKTVYAKFVESDDENKTLSKKVLELVEDYYYNLYQGLDVYDDLDLVTVDPYYGCNLVWTSSDETVMKNSGFLYRDKVDRDVTLNLELEYNGVKSTLELSLTIKGTIYRNLKRSSIVAAYVYTGTNGNRPVDDILLDTVDVIYLAFGSVQSDGSIIVGHDWEALLEKFQDKAIEKGIRVVISLNGPRSKNSTVNEVKSFADFVEDGVLRAQFVDNVIEIIKKYNLAGVDIDWEYPEQKKALTYTQLMSDVYFAVKDLNPDYLVTSAIPAGPWGHNKFDLTNSINYMDYVNLMSYDMQLSDKGQSLYHHCALKQSSMTYNACSVEGTLKLWDQLYQVPYNKIIIGAAFYGRYSSVTSLSGTCTGVENGVTIRYEKIKEMLNKSTCKEYYDSTAEVPYCYDSETKRFVTYDNPKSIKAKCDYVVKNKLAGIMWWDYGSDATGDLITAVNEKLTKLKK